MVPKACAPTHLNDGFCGPSGFTHLMAVCPVQNRLFSPCAVKTPRVGHGVTVTLHNEKEAGKNRKTVAYLNGPEVGSVTSIPHFSPVFPYTQEPTISDPTPAI